MSDDNSDSNRGLVKFNAWWLAAAILVLAVIAALVLVLTFGGRDNPEGDTSPSGAPSTPSQPSEDESTPPETGGVCDLPSGSDIPTVGPDAEWVNRSFLLVPESSTFGPVKRDGYQWGCFAPSPTGALFAASNILGGLIAAQDSGEFAAFVESAAVDNDGRDRWIEENGSEVSPPSAGAAPQISGFRFESVKSDEVVVRIGATQGSGDRAFNGYWTMTLVWDDDASTWLIDVERFDLFPTQDELSTFTSWDAGQK